MLVKYEKVSLSTHPNEFYALLDYKCHGSAD